MRSPRLKGPIATLVLRHFPLIEGVVVEDWSNSPRLFRVLVSESFVCGAWAHQPIRDSGTDSTVRRHVAFLASAYEPCRFRTSIRAELSIAAPLMAVFGVCPQSQRSIWLRALDFGLGFRSLDDR
jgi:hypothetical protein